MQITYEVIRPVVLWGQTPKERGTETGVSPRTIYYRANLFDQAGMAALLPAEPPPPVPKQDKRTLPPDIRQEIVDLHVQYPAFRPHEIATICFVKFNRKPAPATIQEIKKLSENPDIGAYRVSAALEQMGIQLSRATCGRYLSINRKLYHLQVPRTPRPKAEMPFRAERRHQFWSVDIRYLDMHRLGGGMIYCISIGISRHNSTCGNLARWNGW